MDGLTALLLANRHPDRVLSFVNIKGNLAPEDCFLKSTDIGFPCRGPRSVPRCLYSSYMCD
jgi:pimeloyl-ACP methyl ester carboxylesterase